MNFEWDEESKRAMRLMLDAEMLGRESAKEPGSESESIANRLREIKNEVIANARLFKGHMFCDGKYIKDTGIVYSLNLATWRRRQLWDSEISVVYNELDAAEKAQEVQRRYDNARSRVLSSDIRGEMPPFIDKISIITAAVDVTRPIRDFSDHFIATYAPSCSDCPYEDVKDAMRGLGYPDIAFRVEGVSERTDTVYRDAARTRDELVAQVKARFKPYEEERIEAGLHRKY